MAPSGFAAGVARLPNREDDVLGHLRKEKDVRYVGVERLVQEDGRLAGREEDHRRRRVLADGRKLVVRQRGAARPVEDDLQVPARERRGGIEDAVAPAHDLDLAVAFQGVAKLGEPVTAARDEDAHLLASGYLCLEGHGETVLSANGSNRSFWSCSFVSPSASTVPDHSSPSGLSAGSLVGLRPSAHSPFVKIQNSFWACASVTASMIALSPLLDERRFVSPSPWSFHAPITSTWSPVWIVPSRSWFESPGIWTARRLPEILDRIPCSVGFARRSRLTCSFA